MVKFFKQTELLFRFLGKPQLFSLCLLWLIVLTVMGTLAQSSVGLFQAQNIFFSSYIYWLGDILPTPGGYTTLGLIGLSLISNLIFDTQWKVSKIGVITVHLGALLLLLGGAVTSFISQEGSMVIPFNSKVDYFSDYRKIELAIVDQTALEKAETITFTQDQLKPNNILKINLSSLEIEILNFFENTKIKQREIAKPNNELKGFASIFELQAALANTESNTNQAGVVFRLRGTNSDQDGIYAIFEEMAIPQIILINGRKILFQLRKVRTQLPFQLHLLEFEKKYYPGTRLAKSFKSKVDLIEGNISQKAVIEMNAPLRHRGYTIYQSSFHEEKNGDSTILVVVKNAGAFFPYISSIIMCLGLLIHLAIKLPKQAMNATR